MLFDDFSLSDPILKAIFDLEHKYATPVQEKVIPEVLRRNDLLASAPTGTGKTAAFAIPLLQLLQKKFPTSSSSVRPEVLVLSPTRELAVQIAENFEAYGKYTSIKTGVVYGGASMEPQIKMLKQGLHLLIATPGRLLDLRKQGYVDLEKISVLVLDEADLMLDMGFIDEVQKIIRLSENLKQRLMFSATIPAKVEYLAKTLLREPIRIEVEGASMSAVEVEQRLYKVPKPQKAELLLHVMREVVKNASVIIFRRTKHGVQKTYESLTKNGFSAEVLYGDKSQMERNAALERFKKGDSPILVATDVAARGLDIEQLDYVINLDLPRLPEMYVHRIGRTGRAGNLGVSISFCSAEERQYLKEIEAVTGDRLSVVNENPYPLSEDAVPQVHKKKGSKYKKGRKGSGSKSKKKRWY